MKQSVAYDSLILATGGDCFIPFGETLVYPSKPNVFSIRTLDNVLCVREFVLNKKPTSCIIIGGKYILLCLPYARRRSSCFGSRFFASGNGSKNYPPCRNAASYSSQAAIRASLAVNRTFVFWYLTFKGCIKQFLQRMVYNFT